MLEVCPITELCYLKIVLLPICLEGILRNIILYQSSISAQPQIIVFILQHSMYHILRQNICLVKYISISIIINSGKPITCSKPIALSLFKIENTSFNVWLSLPSFKL